MPTNVHAIAVTEFRSTVGAINEAYTDKLMEKNPDLTVRVQWIHNRSLSKEPRPGHVAMDGKMVKKGEYFRVPVYEKKGKRWLRTGNYVLMRRPHDPDAPPGQVIQCNCDAKYIVKMKKT